MIELLIKTPSQDDLIFSDNVSILYEVKDTDGVFSKVVFEVADQIIEKTERTNLFYVNLPKNNYVLVAYVKNKYNKEIPNTRKTILFETKPVTLELKNKLSSVVDTIIPDFIQQDYAAFADYVKEYYKWLESTKNLNYIPHNLENYFDVDTIPPEFLETYNETYLSSLPKEFSIDKETGNSIDIATVIKRIKNFYSKKGTEDSFRFLFRLMFDSEITLTYPREKIFKLSNSEWFVPIFVRVRNLTNTDAVDLIGQQVYIKNSDGQVTFSAIVFDSFVGVKKDKFVTTLYLENIQGTFSGSKLYYKTKVLGVEEEKELDLYSMIVSANFINCPKKTRVPESFGENKKYDYLVGEKVFLEPLLDTNLLCLSTCFSNLDEDLIDSGESLTDVVGEWNNYWNATDYDEGVDVNENNNIDNSDLNLILNNAVPCRKCIPHIFSNTQIVKPTGVGFYALVDKINEKGEITKIKIIDPGTNYTQSNVKAYSTKIVGNNTKKSYDCRITYNIGYLFIGEGSYKNKKSILGYFSVLQDNFYYQENSYEIGASITPYRYADVLRKNVHPAGYQPFYRYDILDLLIEPPEIKPVIDFGVLGYDGDNRYVEQAQLNTLLSSRNYPAFTPMLENTIINNLSVFEEPFYGYYGNDSSDFSKPVNSYFPEIEIDTNENTTD
jgi:hypothetical protein